MIRLYTLISFICISFSLLANDIHYSSNATIYEHLVSINKEWKTQDHQLDHLLQHKTSFKSDEDRIQLHLKLVETILRNRTTDHLPVTTRKNRLQNLQALVNYWKDGQFPKNTNHNHRQPYFIDTYGTACAVGHLLQTSGEEALAQRISLEQNFAFIRELQYPELSDWAIENGFETSELAWIQPAYDGCYETIYNHDDFAKVNVMKEIDGLLYIGGAFLFYANGELIRNIAIYDGNNWTGIGLETIGQVEDIVENPMTNEIYFIGNILDLDLNRNGVLKYDPMTSTTTWLINTLTPDRFQKGAFHDCTLYVGGNFTSIDNLVCSNLAAYSGGNWTTTPVDCAGNTAADISLNGVVNDMVVLNDHLVVGGEFTNTPNGLPTPGLAFCNNSTWTVPTGASSVLSSVDQLEPTFDYFPHTNPLNLIIAGDSIMVYDWSAGSIVTSGCLSIEIPANTGRVDALLVDNSGVGPNAAFVKGGTVKTLVATNFYNYTLGFGFTMNGFLSELSSLITYNGSTFLGGDYSNLHIGEWEKVNAGGCGSFSSFKRKCSNVPVDGGLYEFMMIYFYSVELAEFEAHTKENNQVELTWQTHAEQNSSHYEIERSKTAEENSFKKIGEVQAAGNSSQVINYNYLDRLTVQSKYLYYRLKMVDEDGSFEYSEIKVVKLNNTNSQELDLYPNPSEDKITVAAHLSIAGKTQIKVYNLQGVLVKYFEQTTTDTFLSTSIDVSDLASGMYILQVTNEEDRFSTKFHKMN